VVVVVALIVKATQSEEQALPTKVSTAVKQIQTMRQHLTKAVELVVELVE
jgi:hypothetical protein